MNCIGCVNSKSLRQNVAVKTTANAGSREPAFLNERFLLEGAQPARVRSPLDSRRERRIMRSSL